MAEGKWNLETACNCITRNGGKISSEGKKISFGKNSPGLKILGAIDYLVHYCGFVYTV